MSDKIREAFRVWCPKCVDAHVSSYRPAEEAFAAGWQAAIAQQPAPAAPVAVGQEPVAWMTGDVIWRRLDHAELHASLYEIPMLALYSSPPTAQQLEMIHCACGDSYPASSFGAGFISAAGRCENCDAAEQSDADDLVVWRITLPSGESCHFGTESMAKAWGRGSGKVERVDLKARPALELVAAEQPDTVAVPRMLLERLAGTPHLDPDCCVAYYRTQLRALLDGGDKP